jgi:tripartite-type tricarboxylate transporter receptor subunit TctC
MLKRIVVAVGVIVAGLASPALARADAAYPSRPITIVVPFPAGGAADLFSRLIGEKLRAEFGQPVIVENKTGAAGNIGTELVFRSPPDGYTLLTAPSLTFSVNRLLNPNLRFDPRAMEPVGVLATYPFVLYVRAGLPVNSLSELIAYARANPGKLTFASQGQGQLGHIAIEGLKLQEHLDMVHVPYRGTVPALNDLLGGQVDMLTDSLLIGMQHVQDGKLKLLAVGGKERVKEFPNVPTFAETLPGFTVYTWMAVAAPPKTPKEITRKLSEAIARAVQAADIRSRFSDLKVDPSGSTPEQMTALINESYDRWAPVITKANITSE